MLKAITFDFWNTLYKAAPYAFALRRKFLFEVLARNHIDVSVEQVDEAEDVARRNWNSVWRDERRTLPPTIRPRPPAFLIACRISFMRNSYPLLDHHVRLSITSLASFRPVPGTSLRSSLMLMVRAFLADF